MEKLRDSLPRIAVTPPEFLRFLPSPPCHVQIKIQLFPGILHLPFCFQLHVLQEGIYSEGNQHSDMGMQEAQP